MIPRSQADMLAHLRGGGKLRGTRTYPGPWHYKDAEGREYAEDTIIRMVGQGLLNGFSNKPDEITLNITEKGIEAERKYAAGRTGRRVRGAG